MKLDKFQLPKLLTTLMMGVSIISCSSHAQNVDTNERIINSKQYQDGKFHNKKKKPSKEFDFGEFVKAIGNIFFTEHVDLKPNKPLPIQEITKNEFYTENRDAIRFARLGHSTLLLQIGGKVWLTDPVFSERAFAVQWMGPKRFHPVPVTVEDLPEIEGVILSHNHYDHLDYDTIMQLKDRVKHFIGPLGVGKEIADWGVATEKIITLDWWESTKIERVELIATPTQHLSGRGLFDRHKTLWTSWVIRTERHSLYFSGDSGYFEGFKEIGEKYGPFSITFLENGGYHENFIYEHMMPKDTIQAFKDLKGKLLVPVHNGTFDLALHAWYDPMEQITALAEKENVKIVIPIMGQIVDGDAPPANVAWWKRESLRTGAEPDTTTGIRHNSSAKEFQKTHVTQVIISEN